jgi:hypothetical protein
MLPDDKCLYVLSDDAFTMGILRGSDNYLLRLFALDLMHAAWPARVAVPHPDGSRVYVPVSGAVAVLGLHPGR